MVRWFRFVSLIAILVVLPACEGLSPQSIIRLPHVAADLARADVAYVTHELENAQQFAAASGIVEFNDVIQRLVEAAERPETEGGVRVLIEPATFSESVNGPGISSRVLRLQPVEQDDELRFFLRIDMTNYRKQVGGPSHLALQLYRASVRRDWFLDQQRSRKLSGGAFLNWLVNEPDGMFRSYYVGYDATISRIYRPLRASGRIESVPSLDRLNEAWERCGRLRDDGTCWRQAVKTQLGL